MPCRERSSSAPTRSHRLQGSSRPLLLRTQGDGLLGELTVAVGDPAGCVRPPAQRHAVVVNRDVGVVVLGLRELADAVHERERFDEVSELKRALERTVYLVPSLRGHSGSIYDRRGMMTVSTENPPAGALELGERRRAGREIVLELVFRPLANALVPVLVRLRAPPPVVVLANAAVGLLAAFVLARGELVPAALLLQLKTVLDNADGQLARASGRVTLAGRYLDTEADLVVNAALFIALASATGAPWLALAALLALTLVLAVDFNLSKLSREVHGEVVTLPRMSDGRLEGALGLVYRLVFAPLDRLVRGLSARRLGQILALGHDAERRVVATQAYHDRLTLTVLANLGLSTQLAVLGLLLALDAPEVYLWLALAFLALLPALQLRRERLARGVLR